MHLIAASSVVTHSRWFSLRSTPQGGKISFKLGLIGIAIGNAIGGESGGAVGWSVGNAIGGVVESVIDIFT
jgi:hypothetical protein